MGSIDGKIVKLIKYIIFPLVLCIVCYVGLNKGIDLRDAGFHFTRFSNFELYSGENIISTFWSVLLGRIFWALPYGNTWLGLSAYCNLIKVGIALTGYFYFERYLDYRLTFVAVLIGEALTWCPSACLYDYLTFLFYEWIVIFLIEAIVQDKKKYFIIAGIILGISVFSRVSNLAQAVLIIIVFVAEYLKRDEKPFVNGCIKAVWCFAGFVIGCVISLLAVLLCYDVASLKSAFMKLFNINKTVQGYSVETFLFSTLEEIIGTWKYVIMLTVIWGSIVLVGLLLKKLAAKGNIIEYICAIMIVAFTFYCFDIFKNKYWLYKPIYFHFISVNRQVPLLLLISFALCILLFTIKTKLNTKLMVLSFVLGVWTIPMGSNQTIYLVIGNMLVFMPMIFLIMKEAVVNIYYKNRYFANMLAVLLITVSGIMGYHFLRFGLEYNYSGETCDTVIEENDKLKGMITSRSKANTCISLAQFLEENPIGNRAIIYGMDMPGLYFILDLQPAVEAEWMELLTYSSEEIEQQMSVMLEKCESGEEWPIIILDISVSEYIDGNYQIEDEIDKTLPNATIIINDQTSKYEIFRDFIETNEYNRRYIDEQFAIYVRN